MGSDIMRRVFTRRCKRGLVYFVIVVLIIVLLKQGIKRQGKHRSQRTRLVRLSRDWIGDLDPETNRSVNVIINSYGTGKATLLDELFVNRSEVLMLYQPSLKLPTNWYLRGDNKRCSVKSTHCEPDANFSPVKVLKCLIGLLRCSVEALASCMGPSGVVTHPNVARYKSCKATAKSKSQAAVCLLMLRTICTSARVNVISIRNVALDLLDEVFVYAQNIKIIHVFQDARQLLYSDHTKSKMYLNHSGDSFYSNVQSLCKRTKHDLEIGTDIQKYEPVNRFQMIVQERFVNKTAVHKTSLAAMFGIKTASAGIVYDVIETRVNSVIHKYRTFDKKWRKSMDSEVLSLGYDICEVTNDKLGLG